MNLSGKQKNHLRGLAHALNPVVSIGNKGLTESVAAEVELALAQHELIKIKLPGTDKSEKRALIDTLCEQHEAQFVQIIGRVGVIYRANVEPKINLPSI